MGNNDSRSGAGKAPRTAAGRDPYARTAYGIGYIGEGPYTSGNARRAYGVWSGMLRRSLAASADRDVCVEWLNFQAFAAWYDEHYYDTSLQLDLNLTLSGSGLYSPDTCVLIPRELSSSVPTRPSRTRRAHRLRRGGEKELLPQGVYGASGGRYSARFSSCCETVDLGVFGTAKDARSAYLAAKADALAKHAARIDPIMSDDGRAAVARCCERMRRDAGVT